MHLGSRLPSGRKVNLLLPQAFPGRVGVVNRRVDLEGRAAIVGESEDESGRDWRGARPPCEPEREHSARACPSDVRRVAADRTPDRSAAGVIP